MFTKSRILYAVTWRTYVGFETMISPSIEFKKSLNKPTRNVLTATRKKPSEEYLKHFDLLVIKRSVDRLPRVHLEKQETRRKSSRQDFQRHLTVKACLRQTS